MTTAPPIPRRTVIEAVAASTIGTTIEWYDFFLYGTAAALVFPQLFFPDADPFTGQKDWAITTGEDPNSLQGEQGMTDVHSSSAEISTEGTPYSEW